jgi:hypothetical protein
VLAVCLCPRLLVLVAMVVWVLWLSRILLVGRSLVLSVVGLVVSCCLLSYSVLLLVVRSLFLQWQMLVVCLCLLSTWGAHTWWPCAF